MTTRRTQGMNWIRRTTRLAIYLRDGMACVYCGAGVEEGERLTLDHLRPYSAGGSNAPANLVTCCHRCNSSRGTRSVAAFCRATAAYRDVCPRGVERHVRACARRVLPRAQAREILAGLGESIAP